MVNNITDNSYLVSLDVRSLYSNIQYIEGIEVVRKSFQSYKSSISISIIIIFQRFIVTLNNFVFNGVNYLQQKGCAMGNKCAPGYAKLFMSWFEGHFIYHLILRFSKFYFRYIDDIFLIWNEEKEKFEVFLQKINNCNPKIKLKYPISMLVINPALNFIRNQLRNKIVYIANQNTLVLCRTVLHIAKLWAWIRFTTTREIWKKLPKAIEDTNYRRLWQNWNHVPHQQSYCYSQIWSVE